MPDQPVNHPVPGIGPVRAPRGRALTCKNWLIEAAYRMIQNNLDPEVAEDPEHLVVYGGIGKAARNWDCYRAIIAALRSLNEDETLLVQSGKPVGVFRTHAEAPRVLIANSNLVPRWATWEHFHELDRKGLMMFGQMTAGSWIYIGSQGIVQGTYETFCEAGRQHYGGELAGRWILTAGLGGQRLRPAHAAQTGGCQLAHDRVSEFAHRGPPEDPLPGPAGRRSGRRTGVHRTGDTGQAGALDRSSGQRGRTAARTGASRSLGGLEAGSGHRPDI